LSNILWLGISTFQVHANLGNEEKLNHTPGAIVSFFIIYSTHVEVHAVSSTLNFILLIHSYKPVQKFTYQLDVVPLAKA